MDDVFFCSTQNLELNNVAESIRIRGFVVSGLSSVGASVRSKDGCRLLWHIAPMTPEEFDPETREFLSHANVCSTFCVSHHPSDKFELQALLRGLLEDFGGWVGNDNDLLEPRFDLATVDRFHYGDP